MPKCGCAGSTCGCKVTGSSGVSITGTGTAQDPYVIEIDGIEITSLLTVDDTSSVNLTLLGSGTALDPYVLSAVVSVGATVVSTPTNGGTTTLDEGESAHVLEHVSTIATHTIEFPATSSSLKNEITVFANSEITALTVTALGGGTVYGAPDTLGAGNSFTMRKIGSSWRCVGVAWAS